MKIALCFIISYEHQLNKEQLWIDWIQENKDIINVYFHYKYISNIKSPWLRLKTIPPKYVQKTSYFNVVPAYMALMSYAFHHDTSNLWFSMLTESCVPIISPQKFRKLFFEHYQASVIKWSPAYWNVEIHRRANLRLMKKEYWLANDPWFVLSRQHVQKCMIFMAAKYGIYKQINEGGLANESIFAIVLKTFHQLDDPRMTINEISTITDWSRMQTPTSPYFFKEATEENKEMIVSMLKKNKYAMFLRKVDKSFPDDVLKEFIYNTNYHHEYSMMHNQLKLKNNYTWLNYKNYVFIFIFFLFFIFYVKEK